jgi:small subunit ribosomal protein S1
MITMTTIKPKKSSFMSQLLQKEELRFPKVGELVEGPIIARKRSSVFVNLGPMGTGIIFGQEFYNASDILKRLNIGDKISSKIVSVDEEEGYIELSAKEAGEEILWDKLKGLKESQQSLTVTVSGANKGGLLANIEGIAAFLPASQLSMTHYPRVEGGDKEQILHELQKLVGKPIEVKVLDIDPRERKLILSEKSMESAALKNLVAQFKSGDVVEGEISGVVDFGAFFRFGTPIQTQGQEEKEQEGQEALPPLEGLIHISELDWKLVERPSEIVTKGDKVKAKIIDISPEGRVSLSLKALKEDPWKEVSEKFKKGDAIKGTVVKFNPYGAFVKINSYIQGLIHISEFGTQQNMQGTLEIGKEYEFRILLMDTQEHRMALGLPAEEQKNIETEKLRNKETEEQVQTKVPENIETSVSVAEQNLLPVKTEGSNEIPAVQSDEQQPKTEESPVEHPAEEQKN